MLSKAYFWEALLNGPGVTPPLVLSIVLPTDILHPAKIEGALTQTWAADRWTNMPPRVKDCCWLELRFSHQKQIYTDISLNHMLGLGPSNRNSTAEFFLFLVIEFRYLEIQENLSWNFKHLDLKHPRLLGDGVMTPVEKCAVTMSCRTRACGFQWAHLQPFMLQSN